ncbi:MAG: GTPase HflX [Clostridiales bacterium]|nr:GTPase HflX [Clostridiales bacterium]
MDEIFSKQKQTRAVLVALTLDMTDRQVEVSLDELERLLETAGGVAAARVVQPRSRPDPRTYIGAGKAEEIRDFISSQGEDEIDLAVFDNELTPSQIAALEDILGVRVIDRTMLILDIFALHAVTGEGKLQVEIACLRYTAPRLIGKGKQLSRLGGGIGTRGPGESQLETDRRHIKRRIAALQEELEDMEKVRGVKRSSRERSGMVSAAIVGYTNAGKSTLLNRLTDAGILAEDKLFATLDPTTRRLTLPSGNELLLTDTVGFIDRLPTHLIKAFRSTLEEMCYADIIITLTDSGECDEERRRKNGVTRQLIDELGASDKPLVEVWNKCDVAVDTDFIPPQAICISAATGEGIDGLLARLDELASQGKRILKLFFPHGSLQDASAVYRLARVISTEYLDDGVSVTAECDARAAGKLADYIVK